MSLKWITTLTLIAAFAFGAGRWSAPSPVVDRASPETEPSVRESEAIRILQEGATEIATISNPSERQRLQVDLLEKLVKLFMVDLSLRISETSEIEPGESPTLQEPPVTDVAEPEVPPPAPTPARVSPEQRGVLVYRVVDAPNAEQLRQSLDAFSQLDPMPAYREARTAREEELLPLMGRHRGVIETFEGNKTWRVTLDVSRSAKWTPSSPSYRLAVRIVHGPGSTSNSTGDGPLSQFRLNNGDNPPAFFIDVRENALQLYPRADGRGLVGLYLESKNRSPLKPAGRVILDRAP